MAVLDGFSLRGRRALVTGASRGIGRATSVALAEAGADVTLVARQADVLETVALEIEALGRRAHTEVLNLRDLDAIAPVLDRAVDVMGGIDILVNNAGVTGSSVFEVTSAEDFDHVFDTNFGAVLFTCEAARSHLAASSSGVIINIGSIAATKGVGLYGASKAAVHSLTRGLSREWAVEGIRCVALAPGQVETDMTSGVRDDSERLSAMLAHTARGRIARAEEIAAAVVYLASPAADFVSGEVMAIDGGRDFFPVG